MFTAMNGVLGAPEVGSASLKISQKKPCTQNEEQKIEKCEASEMMMMMMMMMMIHH